MLDLSLDLESVAIHRKRLAPLLDAYQTNLWSSHGLTRLDDNYPVSAYVEGTNIFFEGNGIDQADVMALGPNLTVWGWNDQSDTIGTQLRAFSNGNTLERPHIALSNVYLGHLQFDGSADFFSTPANFGGVSGATIFLRGYLRSAASVQIIFEHSTNFNSNDAFVAYYDSAISRMVLGSHQNTGAQYATSEFNVDVLTEAVWCFRFDRTQTSGANQCVLFRNGVKQTRTGATGETTPVPSGNLGSYPLHIGARGTRASFAQLNAKTLAVYSAALSDGNCTAISAILAA